MINVGFRASTQPTIKMKYKRAKVEGGTFFFTVVTYNRQPILLENNNINILRESFRYVMKNHPFKIDAAVILPDHLHTIWTLPQGDKDFSTRWRLIKSYFSRKCYQKYSNQLSKSRKNKQEKNIWQRRFWEHTINDETDFNNHINYIHNNPVKHGLVNAPKDWEYSSFLRYVKEEIYPLDWGTDEEIIFPDDVGIE